MSLKAPPAAQARQTMHNAFKELEDTVTLDDSGAFRNCPLSRVREEALDIENQLAARGSLRNMRRLMPLFTALEHYSKAIDVLCNGTPYMPWIWAPITLVLRIASEYVEAFEKLVEGYSRIAASLQRFELLGNAFNGDTEFQQTLAIFYADILEFHKHAYKFVRRNGWRLLFLTSWGRFQRRFDNILEDMKRHETLIDREANARNISEATKIRKELLAWKQESLENIHAQDRQQSAKEFMTIISWLQINESDQLSIFESIAGQGERHPGTCMWVTQNKQFRSWLQDEPNTPILWLSGNAGFGKSVIATQIINFIKISRKTVFHHFCTYASAASSTYDQILKSLLHQVLREDAEWTSYVYNDFILKRKPASVPNLEQLLRTVLTSSIEAMGTVKYIWIVLDGINELCESMQMRLLSLIKHISGSSTSGGVCCKLLVSSRSSRTTAQVLAKKPKVSLTDQKSELNKAIEQYSRQRLELLGDRLEQLGVETNEINEIGRKIAEKADGMFLYARLVMDYLSSNIFLHQKELRDSIDLLPKELSEFYRKVLAQILAPLDTKSVEHIKCVLSWLAFSRRPLKKHELLSAVSFSSGNPDVERPAPEYILSVCGPLIEERNDTTITFIHVSVQDFLQNSSSNLVIEKQKALQQHCLAAVTCLLSSFHLLDDTTGSKYRLVVRGLYDFHLYASEYWADYLLDEAGSPEGLHLDSQPYQLVILFFSRLERLLGPQKDPEEPPEEESDPRWHRIRDLPQIYNHLKTSFQARSLEQLEEDLKHQDDNDLTQDTGRATSAEGASVLLACYQEAVAYILQARHIPGISANDLESFRIRSRSSAYTCRLRSCPRATLGFESAQARDEHEVAHARRFPCTVPSCQYPAFNSSQRLKRHVREKHSVGTSRRQIRQPHTTIQRQRDGGITMQSPAGESLKRTNNGPQSSHHSFLSSQTKGPEDFSSPQQQKSQQILEDFFRDAKARSLQKAPEEMPDSRNAPQDPAIRAMLAQLTPEQRQKFRQLPAEQLNELFAKWKRTGMLRPGQPQQATPTDTASTVSPTDGATPEQSKESLMDLFLRGGNPFQHPQAQQVMDNMDFPPELNQVVRGKPPGVMKWRDFWAWVTPTNAFVPDEQKQILRNVQLSQFRRMVMNFEDPQQPEAPNANPLGNLPPNTPIPDVTALEIRQFRRSQREFHDASDGEVKLFLQRLKIQRMRQATGELSVAKPHSRT